MKQRVLTSEIALIGCFVLIIAAVPLLQIGIELKRGQRVQSTDLFRYPPTEPNLRQYERTLESASWAQQALRPVWQQALWRTFGSTTADAVAGRDGWMFYRPDLRYLLEPDRRDPPAIDGIWVRPGDSKLCRDAVVDQIVRFRDQLAERGIKLLVMPVPGKPAVYPDRLTTRVSGPLQAISLPTRLLLNRLSSRLVQVVELPFETIRRSEPSYPQLYLERDTHWSPSGMKRAAAMTATAVRQLVDLPRPSRFTSRRVRVMRYGDIPDMMRSTGLDLPRVGEVVECEQVVDPVGRMLVPSPSERPGVFRDPSGKASILLLGDSFMRIYQLAEPASLGEMAERPTTLPGTTQPAATGGRRLLPGSAGFLSHLSMALGAPVDAIISDGGASTDVRLKLSTNPEILENKKLVIWEFVERDIGLGREGWKDVPLPAKLQE